MNSIKKNLIIASFMFFSKIVSIPTGIWFGIREGLPVVLIGEHHVSGTNPDETEIYELDTKYFSPILLDFTEELKKYKSNFILECPNDTEREILFKEQYAQPNNADSLSQLRNLSFSNKSGYDNMRFKNADIRSTATEGLWETLKIIQTKQTFSLVKNHLEKVSLSQYVKELKTQLAEMATYFDEIKPSLSDAIKNCLQELIEKINKGISELEQNKLVLIFNKLFPEKKLPLSLFVRLLDFKSRNSYNLPKDDITYKQMMSIPIDRRIALIDELKKDVSIDVNEIINNILNTCCHLADLGFLREIYISILESKLTIAYCGYSHYKIFVEALKKDRFETLEELDFEDPDFAKKFQIIIGNILETFDRQSLSSAGSFLSSSLISSSSTSSSNTSDQKSKSEESKAPIANPGDLVINTCASCSATKTKEDKPLSKCSRCKCIYYCSKDCQKKHWPTHKKSCRPKV